jgi:hypothetical protein
MNQLQNRLSNDLVFVSARLFGAESPGLADFGASPRG